MKYIIKTLILWSFFMLLCCTDHNEPPTCTATYNVTNNSSYPVVLKWRTYDSATGNPRIDSLQISMGKNVSWERSQDSTIPNPFDLTDSLVIKFGNLRSKSFTLKDSVAGNLLLYKNYKKKVISEYSYEFSYSITDNDFN